VIPRVTPLADAGSLRAHAEGREVVALRARLVVPSSPSSPGPLVERIRELELERDRLEAERAHLQWRHDQMAKLGVAMGLSGRDRRVDPAERVKDALAVNALVGDMVAKLEARLVEILKLLATNAREREAAAVNAAQGTSAERAGVGHPTRELVVRLAPGASSKLEIAYVIGAARWWPAYTARLSDGATRATWALDAFVAQLSGEDWSGVELALSTADLVHDARLPELPSLRLGRAQPEKRKGYRPPPPGLDEMFEGYDRFLGGAPPAAKPRPAARKDETMRTCVRCGSSIPTSMPFCNVCGDHSAAFSGAVPSPLAVGAAVPVSPAPPPAAMRPLAPPMGAPMPRSAPPVGAAAPSRGPVPADLLLEAAAAPMPQRAAKTMMAGAMPPQQELDRLSFGAAPTPAALEPADAWLDFDSLRVEAQERARRGRLVRVPDPTIPGVPEPAAARATIEQLSAPAQAQDPLRARGLFDFRYEAQGAADVPSNARAHRVELRRADAPAKPRFRTVPREAAEIYREVELENPFGTPLLAGPVDVFVDDGLLTTSTIGLVDTGGDILLGLGVEERVRVARNARAEERTAGLLGGSAVVDHEVTMELRSSLGRPITVEVIDRVPVSSDDDLDVSSESTPPHETYDQKERGAPVKGGVRWLVPIGAGGKATVTLRYRLKLPAKSEVVGGNRRE
jgi:hypothetical protein